MARQRFIWPDLWDDPDLGRVSERAMLLYIGCFSNADDDGRLYADPAFLKAEIFRYRRITEEEIEAALEELSSACSAFHLYEKREIRYLAFLNWSQWQKPKYPRPSKLPAPAKAAQTAYDRQNSSGNGSGRPSRTRSEPVPEPSRSSSSTGRDGLGSTPLNPPSAEPPPRRRRRRSSTPSTKPGEVGRTVIGLRQAFAAWLAGAGWDETYTEVTVRDELDRMRAGQYVDETLGPLSDEDALELWRQERDRRYADAEVPA